MNRDILYYSAIFYTIFHSPYRYPFRLLSENIMNIPSTMNSIHLILCSDEKYIKVNFPDIDLLSREHFLEKEKGTTLLNICLPFQFIYTYKYILYTPTFGFFL